MRIAELILLQAIIFAACAEDKAKELHGKPLDILDVSKDVFDRSQDVKSAVSSVPFEIHNNVVKESELLFGDNFRHVTAGPDNSWALCSMEGLFLYSRGRITHFTGWRAKVPGNGPLPDTFVSAGLFAHDGSFWAGTQSGAARIDGENWSFLGGSPHLHSIECLYQTKNGRIVLGARFAQPVIYNFEKREWKTLWKNNELNSWISSIAEDSKGNLWFGVLGEGVMRYDVKNLELFNDDTWIPNAHIHALHIDKSDNVFVGTDAGLGIRFADGRTQTFRQKDRLTKDTVRQITADPQGQIWIVCNSGLAVFDGKNWLYPEINGDLCPDCEGICFRSDKSVLGFFNGELWINPAITLRVEKPDESIRARVATQYPNPPKLTQPVERDRNGTIWLGLSDGLWSYDGKTWTHRNELLKENRVKSFFKDSTQRLWAVTLGDGLVDVTSNPPRYLNRTDDLNSYIRCVVEHNDGTIYVGTSYGLWSFSNDKWKQVLKDSGCNALAIDAAGRLWFIDEYEKLRSLDGAKLSRAEDYAALNGFRVRRLLRQADGSIRILARKSVQNGAEQREFKSDGTNVIETRQ